MTRLRAPRWLLALAWGVHLYTALGLACAAGMAVLIFRGDGTAFRGAFWLMVLATAIDATDGALARAVRIKETLPGFDGRKLDDIVDYLTYVALPLLLVWRARLLPEGAEPVLLLPLFAGAYGFCQAEAKLESGYFVGFPSCWNLVALYLYALQPLPGWLSVGLVVAFAALTFVPSLYLYPSQPGLANRVACALGAAWAPLLMAVVRALPDDAAGPMPRGLALLSASYPIYYLACSWLITLVLWRRVPAVGAGPGEAAPAGEERP
jgi:phosphatidylcholine synthase